MNGATYTAQDFAGFARDRKELASQPAVAIPIPPNVKNRDRMTFLNPLVLFALVAAGIPLIIHLINLRKPRRIDFSSLAFLQELRRETLRRLRIKQWILLLLRTLAIAFLVLAFARPVVKSPSISALSSGHRSVVAVLDNSLSMDLRNEGGALMDQATEFVSGLAAELGGSDELAVVPLVNDGVPNTLGRPSVADAELAEITPEYGRATFDQALEETASVLAKASYPVHDVYIVSDFQRTNFADSTSADWPNVERLVLVPIGDRSIDNVAVTGVRVRSSIVEVGQPATVEIEVQNFSADPIRNWGLSIYLEGERVAQSTIALDAGQRGTTSIAVTPRARGWLKGRAVLEEDGFEYDNERWFTLHVPEERRILVVKGSGRSAQYLDLALKTELRDGKSLFDLHEVSEAAVSGTFTGNYDGIILLGLRQISTGLAAALADFVNSGGGVLLFAGEEAGEGAYDSFLSLEGAGTFAGVASAPRGQVLTTANQLDREHPLFRGIFDEGSGRRVVEQPAVTKIVRYRPGSGDEQTLLGTTAGLPMLQEVRHASGKLLIAPFVPEPDWTDLPVRGLFVPLLFRSMFYLTSSDERSGDGIRPGAETMYRLTSRQNVSRIRIVSDSGREWIPEQRSSARGLYFRIPTTLRQPGIYDVMGNEGLVQRFAVNMDPLESDLERLDASDAAQRLGQRTESPVSVIDLHDFAGMPVADSIRLHEAGVEIWNVFLMIALVFLVAEMLVAARWRPVGASSGST